RRRRWLVRCRCRSARRGGSRRGGRRRGVRFVRRPRRLDLKCQRENRQGGEYTEAGQSWFSRAALHTVSLATSVTSIGKDAEHPSQGAQLSSKGIIGLETRPRRGAAIKAFVVMVNEALSFGDESRYHCGLTMSAVGALAVCNRDTTASVSQERRSSDAPQWHPRFSPRCRDRRGGQRRGCRSARSR